MCSNSEMFIAFFFSNLLQKMWYNTISVFSAEESAFFSTGNAETLCNSFESCTTVKKVSKYKHKQCCAYLSFF